MQYNLTANRIRQYDFDMKESVSRFIKNSVSLFVKKLTKRGGWTDEDYIQGYRVRDLIEFGYLIPACDLIRILEFLDEGETKKWFLEFQIAFYKTRIVSGNHTH